MSFRKQGFYIIVLSSSFLLGFNQASGDLNLIWEKGKKAVTEGRVKEALRIWDSALNSDNYHKQTDPRIGIGYIETVTNHKIRDRYQQASDMFYWGLSKGCSRKYKEELKNELDRTEPILNQRDFKKWKGYLNSNLDKLCRELKKFWIQLDPTISTTYNERLLEHWERIAFARETFTRNRSTIYDADERAPVYVKLGKADYIKSGIMHFNKPLVRSWIYDAIDFQYRGGSGNGSSSQDSSSAGGAITGQVSQSSLNSLWQKSDHAERFARQAEILHKYQRYEIWVYRDLLNNNENLIYIFGQDGDTGEFRKLNSLEEMIPSTASGSRSTKGSLIKPDFLLQLLFYQQVMHVDNYFADAFSELESKLVTTSGINRLSSFAAKQRNVHKLSNIQIRAPQEKSTYLKEMPEVSLQIHQYRLLGENNSPYLATYVVGQPQKAFFFDQIRTNNFNPDHYGLRYFYRMSDQDNNILNQEEKTGYIPYEGRGNVENMEATSIYFSIPHLGKDLNQFFTVELKRGSHDSTKIGANLFPYTIRAIGTEQRKQPELLATDKSILEISDVIVGTSNQASVNSENSKGELTNFSVAHDRTIPKGSNLMIHFEVYHLKSLKSQINKFKVEYKVEPLKRNFFQRLFGNNDKVGLTLNFDTFDSFYKSDIEIVTDFFKKGKYKLNLGIIEPSTNRRAEREIVFEIQ